MKLLLERQAATAAKRICILKAGDSVYAVGKAEIISSRSGTEVFGAPGRGSCSKIYAQSAEIATTSIGLQKRSVSTF